MGGCLWRPLYIAYPPPFSNFVQPPLSHFPATSDLHPNCSFCCPVSLAEWVIIPHLMCYLPNDNMDLHMSSLGTLVPEGTFMQQGVRFTEVWHIMWFFTGTLIWYHKHTHTHTHTQHTQGPVDWHSHINVYLHHLLCAQSSYLYYIKWLNKWLNE